MQLRSWIVGEMTLTKRVDAPVRLMWIDLRLLNISIEWRVGTWPDGADRRA
jgi:hypothetical protein